MANEVYLSNLSGQFDYKSILDKYQQLKSQQIALLQSRENTILKKKSVYESFTNSLNALDTTFSNLTDSTIFDKKSVAISDDSVLKVSITDPSKVKKTNINIQVNQLAKNDAWLSQSGVSDKDSGAVASQDGTIELKYAGSTVATIDYDTDDSDSSKPSTLQEIANAINNSQDKVTASIFYDGSNYRLLLNGKDTGKDNTIKLTETGNGDLLNQLQIGTYDSNGDGTDEDHGYVQEAQNAQINVYGTTVESSTNSFENVIDGLKIDVLSTSNSSVNVAIDSDYSDFKKSLQGFIDSYNNIVDFISKNTSKNGTLSGDFTLQQIRSSIFDKLDPLFELGILDVDHTTGKISADDSKLDNQLNSNLDDVKSKISDLKSELGDYVDYITGYDNPIKYKEESLDNQVNSIKDSIQFSAKRLDSEMENLKNQFVWLDKFLGEMNGIKSRLGSLFSSTSSNSKS